MSRNNRTNFLMEYEFTYPETGHTEEASVWIPFDIFVEAVRRYCDFADVNLDGTDTNIWNLLVDLDCLDKLADDEHFLEYCKELYKDSYEYEEDYDSWVDDYEYLNDLGKYAEPDVEESEEEE